MLTQNMSFVADHSGRSSSYGSYKLAVQVATQPPTPSPHGASHMGEGKPTYTHLMQPVTAPCMNESALLNGRLPPVTLLTSRTLKESQGANVLEAGKSAECRQGVVCRRSLA